MFKPNTLAAFFGDGLPKNDVLFVEQALTRLEFRNICCQLSLKIKELNADCVALSFTDQVGFLSAFIACLSCGVVPVLFAPSELNFLRLRKHYRYLLTDKDQKSEFSPIRLDWKEFRKGKANPVLQISSESKLKFFTSGTTGIPKEIIKTVAQMDQEAVFTSSLFHKEVLGTVLASTVDEFHHYGLSFSLWLPVAVGVPFLGKKIFFSEDLVGLKSKLSLITSPTFLRNLDTSLSIQSVCHAFSAGGKLDIRAFSNAMSICSSSFTEIYGSTETGIIGYRTFRNQADVPAWKIPEGLSIVKVTDTYRLYSPFVKGGFCDLDDELELLNDREFNLKGRKDRTIKIGERRYNLEEIEKKISVTCSSEVCLVVLNRHGRQFLGAVLFTTDLISYQDIINWRKRLLALVDERVIPRFWRTMSSKPFNAQGKIDQTRLLELFND